MEMEYINENLIRVFIETSDLIERGISFFDLMSNQEEVEKFFMTILHEVDVSNKFENTEAITFQVLPKKDGIDLYISKAQDEDGNFQMDALEEIISRDQNNQDEPLTTNNKNDVEDKKIEETQQHKSIISSPITIQFNLFEDFLSFAKDFTFDNINVDLYLHQDTYYALIDTSNLNIENDNSTQKEVLLNATEFGIESIYSGAFIREHGKELLSGNAHKVIQDKFNL